MRGSPPTGCASRAPSPTARAVGRRHRPDPTPLTPAVLLALALVLAPLASHAADTADLYQARCAVCHGVAGQGDGPAAALLTPAPRDFTTGVYKFRSTPSGTLPTEADVLRTITRGLPG